MLIQAENRFYDFGFVWFDDYAAVGGLPKAVCRRPAAYALLKAFANAPFQVFRDGAAFLLSKGSQHCQQHFRNRRAGINAFLFKIKLHADALQMAHI